MKKYSAELVKIHTIIAHHANLILTTVEANVHPQIPLDQFNPISSYQFTPYHIQVFY